MKKFWFLALVFGALVLAPVKSRANIDGGPCFPIAEVCSPNASCGSCQASVWTTYFCPDTGDTYTVAGGCCYCT